MRHHHRTGTGRLPIAPTSGLLSLTLAGGLFCLGLSGCAVEIEKTVVVQPVESKLTSYNSVEIPEPKNPSSPAEITHDFHEKMLLQIGTMGKFRRVAAAIKTANQQTVVIQATIVKWDAGNRFLRWWGAVGELLGGIYESYAKQQIGTVTGTVGDGYLLVDVQFLDKTSQQVIGKLTIKALADSPDSYRAAEDRAVEALRKYLLTRV
ncbi:MAG: hypothetical protein KGJ14_04655 [Nitrospirota bacterium]|nr:hypothetical protein [Nitrospirota bacterium]